MGNDIDLALRLGLTLVLCFCIGLEREVRQKSAGLRTHTLVGLGAAVAMMVSKYGFADLANDPNVSFDPSRVAAQVVSGIGFIGAGIIFVRRESVRGLTTAGAAWLTAMIGMAAGAGMYVLAVAATASHFLVVLGYPAITRHVPGARNAPIHVRVTYLDGRGVLREIISGLTSRGFTIADMAVERAAGDSDHVTVSLEINGPGTLSDLTPMLAQFDGVVTVQAGVTAEQP